MYNNKNQTTRKVYHKATINKIVLKTTISPFYPADHLHFLLTTSSWRVQTPNSNTIHSYK